MTVQRMSTCDVAHVETHRHTFADKHINIHRQTYKAFTLCPRSDIFTNAMRVFTEDHRMTLLLIDEIDAICPKREEANEQSNQLTAILLANLDGVSAHPGLLLLATTNRPG